MSLNEISSTEFETKDSSYYNNLMGLLVSGILHGHDLSSTECQKAYAEIHDLDRKTEIDINKEYTRYADLVRNYSYEEFCALLKPKVIVSFTTYPPRINSITETLKTIYNQSFQLDEVILCLAESDFPGKKSELPDSVMKLVEDGRLTILWGENLKPHKKYFYPMLARKDDVIITIDDDLFYEKHMVEKLYLSYLAYPTAVSACRCHLIMFDRDNHFLPYKQWGQNQSIILNKPFMGLFPTNGAGSLFPPHILDTSFFDIELIKSLCLSADDLWLKTIEVLTDVPIVAVEKPRRLEYVPGTQETALWKENVVEKNGNDVALQRIKKWVDEKYGQDCLEERILNSSKNTVYSVYDMYQQRQNLDRNYRKIIAKTKAEIVHEYESSFAYRVGMIVTYVPRKIMSIIRKPETHE